MSRFLSCWSGPFGLANGILLICVLLFLDIGASDLVEIWSGAP